MSTVPDAAEPAGVDPAGVDPGAASRVAELARRIAELPGQERSLTARAARLAEKAATARYHIAVLGDFKRGKSTVVNALIARTVLPTGVLPLTTVATEVRFGSAQDAACVIFEDGRRLRISVDEVSRFVSEEENPGNRNAVVRVEIEVVQLLGAPGVVLVDTPGLASVSERQSTAARDALEVSDGAVVVLSVDSPLSQSEATLVTELGERGGRCFIVVNKCDHVSSAELDQVRGYVAAQLERLLGRDVSPYMISARRAIDARGGGPGGDPGFDAFRRDLVAFVRDELAAARQAAEALELGRLAAGVSAALAVERAAANLDLDTLGERLRRFEAAADDVRRLFADDRHLLDRDVAAIIQGAGRTLTEHAAGAAAREWPRIADGVATVRGRALDRALDDAVAGAVRRIFEPLRLAAQSRIDEAWGSSAARFARQVHARASELRAAANELFDVCLPDLAVPMVAAQPERFSYVFLHVESPGTSLGRFVQTLLPTRGSRRRMLEAARLRFWRELDKHAGRARYDFGERLEAAKRSFVADMTAELDEIEASIVTAVHTARAALEETEARQSARAEEWRHAAEIASEAERLVRSVPMAIGPYHRDT